MRKAIALLFLPFLFLAFPFHILAANYGDGHYGSGDYNVGELTPTPTPTATPTPAQNNNSNSSDSSSNNSNNSAPSCNDSAPSTPKLFQADVKGDSTKLFFTPLSTTNKFFVSFSTKSNAEEHGVEVTLAKEGVQNYTVNALKPNATYYFKIRGQNGCMPGGWSNIVKVKTGSVKASKTISYYMNSLLAKVTSVFSSFKLPKVTKPSTTTKEEVVPQQVVPKETNKPESIVRPQPPIKKQTCVLWWCW